MVCLPTWICHIVLFHSVYGHLSLHTSCAQHFQWWHHVNNQCSVSGVSIRPSFITWSHEKHLTLEWRSHRPKTSLLNSTPQKRTNLNNSAGLIFSEEIRVGIYIMAFHHRALWTWFIILIFLILLVLRLDEQTGWPWFIVFIPMWLYDAILFLYLMFNMIMHCKNGRQEGSLTRKIWWDYCKLFIACRLGEASSGITVSCCSWEDFLFFCFSFFSTLTTILATT